MWILQVFLMLVTVTGLQPVKDEFVNQAKMRGEDHQLLQRFKRHWVITTFELNENDPGPFPKLVGELYKNVNYSESLIYIISGPGVNKHPIGLFSIDNRNGKVYVHRSIDREEIQSFLISFEIADRSTLETVDKSLFFVIKVGDINDNAPQFAGEEFNITIKENHNLDNPVFQVVAVDLDKEQTPNSEVSYSLVSQVPLIKGNEFYIDHSSGEIHVSGCLDYAAARFFKLLIRANDHGEPSLSSTATVNIAIEDGNNHMPTFTKGHYKVQISEDQIQQDVVRLPVQDHDSPFTPSWRAKYKILRGNEEEHFNIVTDPETNEGILNVIKPLDYENLPERKLVIVVENEEPFYYSCEKDQLGHGTMMTSTATVSVEVIDINDPPQFHPPNFIVQEADGAKPGIHLGRFNAIDSDGSIRFKLVHDPANWVTVDELSGMVTTVKHVDRESPYVNNSFYTIMVSAIDDGVPPQTSTGTMMLFLSDKNDNTPILVKPYLEVCNMEKEAPILVEAEDKDLDPFSGPFTFELDDTSGNIKDTWKLGKNFGYSVELLILRSLQNGVYSVPFIILDKQGFFKKQILNVSLCSCLDGVTCERSSVPFVGLGGGAIIPICAAFMSLAALLFLLWCSFGSTHKRQSKSISYEQGNQTLIRYNEESENTLPLMKSNFMGQIPQLLVNKEKETYYPDDISLLHTKRQPERIEEKMAEILTQKLYDVNDLEDNTTYQPHNYNHEGEFEAAESLSSLTLTESDLPEDFLDDLGSRAIALEKIFSKSVFLK